MAELVERQVIDAARVAHPLEAGGILLGVSVGRQFWVTQAVEILSALKDEASFWLPSGITHAVVEEARQEDDRLGYVGEWHVHPGDQGPSGQDARTMRRVSFLTRKKVILLLARNCRGTYRIEASSWSPVVSRDLVLIRTGPLPLR